MPSLSVVSRTSASRLADDGRPLREMAAALGADALMEAAVLIDGGRLRVEARVVDGRTDRKFWVGEFAGNSSDLGDLQRRIAVAAAAAVATRIR